MKKETSTDITDIIGKIPYKIALAGGWIDQPFVSMHNPDRVGSMVTIAVEPAFRFMDRSGMSTSTRNIAGYIWKDGIPERDPMELVKELYREENKDRDEPSGSQDMIGLIYPGINRLDYDYSHEMGYFPRHIESCLDHEVINWFEHIFYILPICPRPPGYNPLGIKNLDPELIRKLGQSGKDCYSAIINKDIAALGLSMNTCMICWEGILPHILHHDVLTVPLLKIVTFYQEKYPGAMYSGCGGGYLFVVSEEPVPGGIHIKIKAQ